MKVQCEICYEWIGIARKVSYPMMGHMFASIDPFHGFPQPFPDSADWESMRCPYGPHRPFTRDDILFTDEGVVNLKEEAAHDTLLRVLGENVYGKEGDHGSTEEKGYACETCGKRFEKEINLRRHQRMAHKEA